MGFTADALRGGTGDRGGGGSSTIVARRMLINQVRLGRLRRDEVCDAHPRMIRAPATSVPRPDGLPDLWGNLRIVTYVFGHRLPAHGRCVSTATEMRRLSDRGDGQATAYMVEACTACRWHHLLRVWSL
jgi:hypothetical protein